MNWSGEENQVREDRCCGRCGHLVLDKQGQMMRGFASCFLWAKPRYGEKFSFAVHSLTCSNTPFLHLEFAGGES